MADPNRIRKVIGDLGLAFKENSNSYIFDCPICKKSKKLYIRKRDGVFVCFKCKNDANFCGKPEWALAELSDQSVSEIRKMLYDALDPEWNTKALKLDLDQFFITEEFEDTEQFDKIEELPEVPFDPDFVTPDHPSFEKGRKYLYSRNVSGERILQYGIRYHPSKERVVVPVYKDTKLLGWQGRYVGSNKAIPKILTSNGLTGGNSLMFYDNLKGSSHCVLTEGPFDGIKAHLCGGNVTAMGKGVSKKQLALIYGSGIKKLYIGFDPDASQDVMRVAKEMYEMELYHLTPPKHREDLGDCLEEEVYQQFTKARRITPNTLIVHLKDIVV